MHAFLAMSVAYEELSTRQDKASRRGEEDPRIPARPGTAELQSRPPGDILIRGSVGDPRNEIRVGYRLNVIG